MDVSDWRERIDQVDLQILALLNERARCVLELAPLKRRDAIPVHEPKREAKVFANLQGNNQGPLENDAVQRIFERIIEVMRAVQQAPEQLNGGPADAPPKSSSATAPLKRGRQGDGTDLP